MTDIVKRLRTNHPVGTKPDPLLFEAADEIERLREAIMRTISTCMTQYAYQEFISNRDHFLRRVLPKDDK